VTSKGNQAPPSAARSWADMTVVAITACSERNTDEMSSPSADANIDSDTMVSTKAPGLRK